MRYCVTMDEPIAWERGSHITNWSKPGCGAVGAKRVILSIAAAESDFGCDSSCINSKNASFLDFFATHITAQHSTAQTLSWVLATYFDLIPRLLALLALLPQPSPRSSHPNPINLWDRLSIWLFANLWCGDYAKSLGLIEFSTRVASVTCWIKHFAGKSHDSFISLAMNVAYFYFDVYWFIRLIN